MDFKVAESRRVQCHQCASVRTFHDVEMYALAPPWFVEKTNEFVIGIGICGRTGLWIVETERYFYSSNHFHYNDLSPSGPLQTGV